MMKLTRLVAIAVLAVSGTALAQAVPTKVGFNARLTNTSGAPLSGSHNVIFSLFSASTGGSQVWTETYSTLGFAADGTITVELGTNTPLTPSIFDGNQLYLEISV